MKDFWLVDLFARKLLSSVSLLSYFWNESNFRKRKPDSLHLRDSPRKRLSRAIPISSSTNPYNAGIKEELHNIIKTLEYNSSAQAEYKSDRTESRKIKTPMQRIYRSEASPAPQANSSIVPALVFTPSA
jgi:hypothetical protein